MSDMGRINIYDIYVDGNTSHPHFIPLVLNTYAIHVLPLLAHVHSVCWRHTTSM